MRIVPVIDLLAGNVVRGSGGRRAEYRPLQTQLAADATPAAVARAFCRLGFKTIYVADLDAIAGQEPGWAAYQTIALQGAALWIDAGLRDARQAQTLANANFAPSLPGIVAGLESLPDRTSLAEIVRAVGRERLIFSLDLKDGAPLTTGNGWAGMTARQIAVAALDRGVRRMIVLDLARVGNNDGVGMESLYCWLRERDPELEITLGGGVRGIADLRRLEEIGCNSVLVASALHDGRLRPEELADFLA